MLEEGGGGVLRMTCAKQQLKEASEKLKNHVAACDGTMRWHRHMKEVCNYYLASLEQYEKDLTKAFFSTKEI